MIVKEVVKVKSLPATKDTIKQLYPDKKQNQEDCKTLTEIVALLYSNPGLFRGSYTCYIQQEALNAFLKHANEIYREKGHEATGLFVGYYLHSPDDEHKKVAVCTHFIPACKGSGAVVCEISHQEMLDCAVYCKEHQLYPLVWPHTHPFGRPLFYSGTDNNTLLRCFSSPHQMGLVCDNTRNAFLGFKVRNSEVLRHDIYVLSKSAIPCSNQWATKSLADNLLEGSLEEIDTLEVFPDDNPDESFADEELVKIPYTTIFRLAQRDKVHTILCWLVVVQVLNFFISIFTLGMAYKMICWAKF